MEVCWNTAAYCFKAQVWHEPPALITKIYTFHTVYIYALYDSNNSDLPEQHYLVGLCNGESILFSVKYESNT